MNFVYPNFLWNLLFIAVPIIIHLFYFRRYKKVYFSNTTILNEIKDERSSRNKLKHLLVLLSRILAIIFLVIAFAQPFFKNKNTHKTGSNFISIYVDNSFSMNAEGNGQLLFDEAKEIANEIIKSCSDNDKIQILSNDFEAKHQRFVNKTEAFNFLKDLKVSSAIRNSKTVFERQKNTFKSQSTENIIYQLSDFQKNSILLTGDTSYTTNIVKLSTTQKRNVFIDTAWFSNSFQLKDATNKMIVKFRNEGNEQSIGNYQLILNKNVKSIGEYVIAKKSFTYDTINFKISEIGWNTGKIQLSDYPITFDDIYYFSFHIEEKVNVLSINEDKEDLFNAVFKDIENTNFKSVNYKKIDYNNLNKQHLIIVNNIQSLPSGLSQNLIQFVKNGGSIFIVPHKQITIETYNSLLSSLEIGYFSGENNNKRQVGKMNLNHFVLYDLFEKTPNNFKLPLVTKTYNLITKINSKEESIFSFKNNEAFLSSFRFKNGNVYLLNSPLNSSISDFSSNALFAPIIYKMAVLSVTNSNLSFEINGNTVVKLKEKPKYFEDVIKMKNNDIEIIPQKNIYGGKLNLNLHNSNLKDGIYKVFTDNDTYNSKVALNYSRKESYLDYYSKEELKNIFQEKNINIISGNISEIQSSIENYKQGKMLWKWFIVFSLLFLAFEILLLRFMKV